MFHTRSMRHNHGRVQRVVFQEKGCSYPSSVRFGPMIGVTDCYSARHTVIPSRGNGKFWMITASRVGRHLDEHVLGRRDMPLCPVQKGKKGDSPRARGPERRRCVCPTKPSSASPGDGHSRWTPHLRFRLSVAFKRRKLSLPAGISQMNSADRRYSR